MSCRTKRRAAFPCWQSTCPRSRFRSLPRPLHRRRKGVRNVIRPIRSKHDTTYPPPDGRAGSRSDVQRVRLQRTCNSEPATKLINTANPPKRVALGEFPASVKVDGGRVVYSERAEKRRVANAWRGIRVLCLWRELGVAIRTGRKVPEPNRTLALSASPLTGPTPAECGGCHPWTAIASQAS